MGVRPIRLGRWNEVVPGPVLTAHLPRTLMRLAALPLAALLALAGCGAADELAAAGAVAGVAAGGCALLDTNDDGTVEREEVAFALFDRYDADDDGALTRPEFEAGTARGTVSADWRGEFAAWDADDDGALSRSEFTDGATDTGAVDASCDDLGL